jgi:hypothetical protein
VINLSVGADDPAAPANNGNFTPDVQMPGAPGTSGTTDNQAAEILTFVDLPAGLIHMGVNSDDNFATYAGPIGGITNLLGTFDASGGRGSADTIFAFAVQQAGTYAFRTVWENGGGGSNIEWFTVKPDGTDALLNDTAHGGFKTYAAAAAGGGGGGGGGSTNGIAAITVTADKTSAVVTYKGTLQSADSLNGPWTDVAGASSPATIPIARTGSKFYRVR